MHLGGPGPPQPRRTLDERCPTEREFGQKQTHAAKVKDIVIEKIPADANSAATVDQAGHQDVIKELARLRARLAEIASIMRGSHGLTSVEARLTEDVSSAVQRLEARLLGCSSAQFE